MDGKNFGFITPDEGDKDMFFHANELVGVSFDELQEGDKVTFEVTEGQKGPAATNVQKADDQKADDTTDSQDA